MIKCDQLRLRILNALRYEPDSGLFFWENPINGRVKKGSLAGSLNQNGYFYITFGGKSYRAHRLAFLFMGLEMPKFVDHIDGNRSNNAWSNLRACTKSQNSMNAKKQKNNKSGVKNVYWHTKMKKWEVYIWKGGVRNRLGHYESLELAELIAREAREKYHGEFANHG